MATPIKVLVSEFQARKMATENTAVIIQVRRRKGQPTRRYKAHLCDLQEIKPPFLEPLKGSGLLSPVEALYRQYTEEVSDFVGHNKTTERRELMVAGRHYLGPKFRGVYSDAESKDIRLEAAKPYMIVNTGNPGSGEHWQAIAYSSQGDVLYDSLGGGDTDPDPEQTLQDSDCGQRSLAWLRVVDAMGLDAAMTI